MVLEILSKDYNPKEVAKVLNKYADKIIAVRGNCDMRLTKWSLISYNGAVL